MPYFDPIYEKIYYGEKGHKWYETLPEQPIYCNICSRIVLPYREKVLKCEYCGSFSHIHCHKQILYDCKHVYNTNTNGQPHEHQWVCGNIPISSICSYCGEDCVSLMELSGYRCMWCQCCLHSECKKYISKECYYGILQDIILSPNNIRLKTNNNKNHNELIVKPINTPTKIKRKLETALKKFTPKKKTTQDALKNMNEYEIINNNDNSKVIIVFINKKAGGLWGGKLLPKFRQLLNPIQVCDLSVDNPTEFLNFYKNYKNLRILICGGDGSVNWVSNVLDNVQFDNTPPIGVLPLGTGNDMSRTLHWGKGYDGEDVLDLLNEYRSAPICNIDRWNVVIRNDKKEKSKSDVIKKSFNCYWGMGLDASVTMKFHNYREHNPHLFTSRLINKLWYTKAGIEEFIEGPAVLTDFLQLECDNKLLELQSFQCIVFLNINHYCGGVEIYPDDDTEHSNCDGYIDIYGLDDTIHTGMMNIGLSKATFITRCKSAKIHLSQRIAMQMDGEPWIQEPGTFELTSTNLFMLKKGEDMMSEAIGTMTDVLMWGESKNIINKEQYKTLLTELTRRMQSNNY